MRLISLFVIQLTLSLVIMNGDLFDDNITQWLPVFSEALNRFLEFDFTTKNIYQFNGFEPIKYGYYGLTNPILLICGLLSKIIIGDPILTYFIYHLFGIYILSYALYKLVNPTGLTQWVLLSFMFIMIPCSGLINTGYSWWYISNNYIIFGLLILAFRQETNKIMLYKSCAILTLSAYMGNIHYTLTHCIFVGVYFFCCTELKLRDRIKSLAFIATIFLILASPVLLNAMIVSWEKYPYLYGKAGDAPISFTTLVFSPFIFSADTFHDLSAYQPIIAFFIYVAFSSLWHLYRGKDTKLLDPLSKSAFIMLCIFLVFSTTTIVNYIPILNKFRFAFKYVFTFYPLLIVPCAIFIKKTNNLRVMYFSLVFIIFTIHMMKNTQTINFVEKYKHGMAGIYSSSSIELAKIISNHNLLKENTVIFFDINTSMNSKPVYIGKLSLFHGNSASWFSIKTNNGYEPLLSSIEAKKIGHNVSSLYAMNKDVLLSSRDNVDYVIIPNNQENIEILDSLGDFYFIDIIKTSNKDYYLAKTRSSY